jgi:Ca2+-binding EF-hand superfamily protein
VKGTTVTITALLAALSTGVVAQTTGNPDITPGADDPASQNFDMYDANRDGTLDESEAEENTLNDFRDMDRDGDEIVDREEFENWHREHSDATRTIDDE